MNATATTSTRPVTIAQLRRAGFTAGQVRQLKALRESYPLREFVASSQDMRRLEFLRWMRQHGRLDD